MSVFSDYASCYELLYKDKDYNAEADYVINLLQKYNPNAQSVLELGCGAGTHAFLFAEKGYSVHGIDLSPEMLNIAQNKLQQAPEYIKNRLSFICSDLCNFELNKKFDAVISLFHVMSYQASNYALEKAFHTASKHLEKGGVFIFDCWYGPGVLTDKPSVRIKKAENEHVKIVRIAEPVMFPNQNTVDVNYHVIIRNKNTDEVKELNETHTMRYLFPTEVEFFFSQCGIKLIRAEVPISGTELGFDNWNACFAGEKL